MKKKGKELYGKVITESVQRLTEEKIGEEQGGFRKGRGCVEEGRKAYLVGATAKVICRREKEGKGIIGKRKVSRRVRKQ